MEGILFVNTSSLSACFGNKVRYEEQSDFQKHHAPACLFIFIWKEIRNVEKSCHLLLFSSHNLYICCQELYPLDIRVY